jgi:hypothetical protein
MKKPRYRESYEEDIERKKDFEKLPRQSKSQFIREAVELAFKKKYKKEI